jgi:hypothetical protein
VTIDRIDRELEPIFSDRELQASSLVVREGETAGFRQRYAAVSDGRVWFEARFTAHVAPPVLGEEPRDSMAIRGPYGNVNLAVTPGLNPQSGSASIVANSVRRVVEARPGWTTVADLPPAVPA